jgi:hypothetical protein
MGLDCRALIVNWRPLCGTRGRLQGPWTRAEEGGLCIFGCAVAGKSECSAALGCPEFGSPTASPRDVCFGDVASVPVSGGVIPGNTWKRKHRMYMQIPSYTYVCKHIRTYATHLQLVRGRSSNIHVDTWIYVHIRAYTNSVRIFFALRIPGKIRTYTGYTCKYANLGSLTIARPIQFDRVERI